MLRNHAIILALACFFAGALAFALAAVDINHASEAELENLPGVGSKLAHEIVEARPFHGVDDLRRVKGIGDAKLARLAPLVTAMPDTGAAAPAAPAASLPSAVRGFPAAAENAGKDVAHRASSLGKKAALVAGERININTAPAEELERLPGIGRKKAEAIIQARPFASPDDLVKVKGIKEKTYAKIKDNVTVQ